MAAQDVVLSFAALLFELIIERSPTWKAWHWNHKVTAAISNEPFDFAFIVPLARAAVSITDNMVGQHRTEPLGSLTFAIRHDFSDQTPIVVIQN